jgi:hypothetical protein
MLVLIDPSAALGVTMGCARGDGKGSEKPNAKGKKTEDRRGG